jgi:hypothetical protein
MAPWRIGTLKPSATTFISFPSILLHSIFS